MRIATWNVNGLRARIDFVVHWLRERKPDVVGLQELKLSDDLFPHDVFEAEGYTAVTHGQKAWNGVAVLARGPVEALQRGLPGQEDFGARLLTVQLEDIRFTTLYCPNGKSLEHDDYGRKLAWFDALAEHLNEHHSASEASIVCGDFNVVPTPLDSWNGENAEGHMFHTGEERSRLQALLDVGFVDVFRQHHPDAAEFSWWDYRGGAFHRKHGLRIDFVLATKPALERVEHVEIDREYRKKKDGLTASDHAPVMVDVS